MASIRKRSLPSGKSVWLVDYQDQSGKRRARQFATKRKAGSYLVRARAAVLHGTHVHGADSVPVAPASQRWLEACARRCQTGRRMECATYQDCEAKLRLHLLDHEVGLGGVKLTRFDPGSSGRVPRLPARGRALRGYDAQSAVLPQPSARPCIGGRPDRHQWFLSFVAGAGFGMLGFMAAIVIAGILLTRSAAVQRFVELLATRLVGPGGTDLVLLAERTIRSVARGVLGTALVQTILVGVGLVVAGIPGAAFLTLIAFLLSVVQLGPALVLLGAVAYKFSLGVTAGAFLFFAWCIVAGVSDNVIRPFLLSRGGDVPMWVILIGTLGGLLAHGLIGLFVGPIVVALGYRLLQVWLEPEAHR